MVVIGDKPLNKIRIQESISIMRDMEMNKKLFGVQEVYSVVGKTGPNRQDRREHYP